MEKKTLKDFFEELAPEVRESLARALYFTRAEEPKLWGATAKKYELELWSEDKFFKLVSELIGEDAMFKAKIQYSERALKVEELTEADNKRKEEFLRNLEAGEQ
jgi:two-component SAPR family response regulator